MYSRNETLRAMGRMMARYAQGTVTEMESDEVIQSAPLLKPWTAGTFDKPVAHEKDEVRTDENQPWRCVQAHTHYGEDRWNPAASRALWAPYHAKTQPNALPYVAPTNAEDAYNTGEWMIWTDGLAYMCKDDATVYGPDVLPGAWEVV